MEKAGCFMKLTKQHILLLTPGFPADENDTTCIPSLQNFVKELAKNNQVKISVLTLHYPTKKEDYTWNKINVYSIGAFNNKFPFRFFSWTKAIKKIKEINKKEVIDLIHSFWLTDVALVGKIASKKLNLKHFITLMGQDVFKQNKYVSWVNPNEEQLIALSKNQAEIFNRDFKKEVKTIIPWGVEVRELGSTKKTIDVLCVGYLTDLKNFKEVISVTIELMRFKEDINVKIIGDGPQKNEITQLINRHNLNANIELLGEIKNEEVIEFMKKSKVLFHPSKYESFGYVFLEALSCKMSVVSYNVGFANPSKNWKVIENVSQAQTEIISLLNSDLNNDFTNEFTLNKTVKEYLMVWE